MAETLTGEFILNSDDANKSAHQSPKEHHSSKSGVVKGKSPHFYSAFGDHPAGVSFAEQEEGEEIVLMIRRHFVTNVPWIAFVVFLAILPITFPIIASTFPFPAISPATIALTLAFYYLMLFGLVLLNFTLWYFHIGLVTNLRVVDVDLAGLLYRQVTTTRHENVEDVTYTQTGFISSLFNYGNVHIQTAGTQENVEYDRVPRPSKVADVISDLAKPV